MTDLELFSRVDACIWPEREVARNAVRPMVAGMLMASYPDTRFVTNLGLRLPQDLLEIVSTKQLERIPEAARLLPDEFVDQYTWAGSASEVAERIAGVVRAGIRNITILPHPPEGERIEPILEAFARDVMPRVRALLEGRPGPG